jgi:hypothetical protein
VEGREKPHTDKYMEITNDWNYDTSCTLASLPVSDIENIKRLIFVAESVQVPHILLNLKPYREMQVFRVKIVSDTSCCRSKFKIIQSSPFGNVLDNS